MLFLKCLLLVTQFYFHRSLAFLLAIKCGLYANCTIEASGEKPMGSFYTVDATRRSITELFLTRLISQLTGSLLDPIKEVILRFKLNIIIHMMMESLLFVGDIFRCNS